METMTEREQIKVGDRVRWNPTPGSPWGPLTIEGVVLAVRTTTGCLRAGMLRVTAVRGKLQSTEWRGRSVSHVPPRAGDVVDVTTAPGVVRRVESVRTPVGDVPIIADPTLRPDEHRIEPGPWNLDADLRERLAGASDAPSADQSPRSEHRSKAFGYVDTNISRALCAADNERVLRTPTPLLIELHRFGTSEPSVQSRFQLGGVPFEADVADPWPRREDRRPDGFDQAAVDAAKAVLLAPAMKRRS